MHLQSTCIQNSHKTHPKGIRILACIVCILLGVYFLFFPITSTAKTRLPSQMTPSWGYTFYLFPLLLQQKRSKGLSQEHLIRRFCDRSKGKPSKVYPEERFLHLAIYIYYQKYKTNVIKYALTKFEGNNKVKHLTFWQQAKGKLPFIDLFGLIAVDSVDAVDAVEAVGAVD